MEQIDSKTGSEWLVDAIYYLSRLLNREGSRYDMDEYDGAACDLMASAWVDCLAEEGEAMKNEGR